MPYPEHPIANVSEYASRHLYLFHFGAYATVRVYVFGTSDLSEALEVAAEWLLLASPGQFYSEADIREDFQPEQLAAMDAAGEHYPDMTYTESGWLASWEWTAHEHDPHETAEPSDAVRERAMVAAHLLPSA